jgi:TonB family protein
MARLLLAALLQLLIASPPKPPRQYVQAGIVLFDAVVNQQRQLDAPRLIEGPAPFVQPSLLAMKDWTFGAATPVGEHMSITFLYRAQKLLPDGPHELTVTPQCCLGHDRPPVPSRVIDPGYPVDSIGEGTVILQLRVDAMGQVEDVMTARPELSLTDAAVQAAHQWTFTPAIANGKPVRSSAIVVIFFRRPAL